MYRPASTVHDTSECTVVRAMFERKGGRGSPEQSFVSSLAFPREGSKTTFCVADHAIDDFCRRFDPPD